MSTDYSQQVKDILDGLGDSPTPDEVYHAVKNYSVDNVVAATAATAKASGGGGGGGGSQTVGCILECQPDVHDQTDIPFKWDALLDSAFHTLGAIPAGLGLTFAFDGTDSTITTTEAGSWALTLGFTVAQDATWAGIVTLDDSRYAQLYHEAALPAGSTQAALSESVPLPSGASIAPHVQVQVAGTADPLFCDCYLTIVRLG